MLVTVKLTRLNASCGIFVDRDKGGARSPFLGCLRSPYIGDFQNSLPGVSQSPLLRCVTKPLT